MKSRIFSFLFRRRKTRTELETAYSKCTLCPRSCRVDRTAGERGFCGETAETRAAAALLHFGEEPPVSGEGGSGTVFFTGCTLKCSFCQNRQLSSGGTGRRVSAKELAAVFLRLQKAGAENINLVTGTHFTQGIAEAAGLARHVGLRLPFVWNTSGYENDPAMDLLDDFVSVYLPDVKTVSGEISGRLYGAPGYAEAACRAVKRMVRTRPLYWNGALLSGGVIVRHMVLPGHLDITRNVLRWYADKIGDDALFSLMFQYTPVSSAGENPGSCGKAPRRRISREEYETVMEWLDEVGIEEGFVQDFENNTEWFPDFTGPDPFPADKSRVIWHWN